MFLSEGFFISVLPFEIRSKKLTFVSLRGKTMAIEQRKPVPALHRVPALLLRIPVASTRLPVVVDSFPNANARNVASVDDGPSPMLAQRQR